MTSQLALSCLCTLSLQNPYTRSILHLYPQWESGSTDSLFLMNKKHCLRSLKKIELCSSQVLWETSPGTCCTPLLLLWCSATCCFHSELSCEGIRFDKESLQKSQNGWASPCPYLRLVDISIYVCLTTVYCELFILCCLSFSLAFCHIWFLKFCSLQLCLAACLIKTYRKVFY